MTMTPCKDCPARHPVCHDSCLKYAEFKRQRCAEAAYTREMLDTGKVYHYDHEDRHRERGRKKYMGAKEERIDESAYRLRGIAGSMQGVSGKRPRSLLLRHSGTVWRSPGMAHPWRCSVAPEGGGKLRQWMIKGITLMLGTCSLRTRPAHT